MNETVYIFKLDMQNRITLTSMLRQVYDFNDLIYMKLQVIDGEKYLQISGYEIDFYQAISKQDYKGRISIPKEVRENLIFKLEISLSRMKMKVIQIIDRYF